MQLAVEGSIHSDAGAGGVGGAGAGNVMQVTLLMEVKRSRHPVRSAHLYVV